MLTWVLAAWLAGCGGGVSTPAGPRPDAAVAPARPDAKRRVAPAPAPLGGGYDCDRPGETFVPNCYVRLDGVTFTQGAQAADAAAPAHDPAARPDEGPPRRVTLPAFRLARHEASRDEFRACVADGWCAADDLLDAAWLQQPPGLGAADERGLAVAGITWTGAARLCAWLGGRLPTEAEWERAARGVDGRRFPWGDAQRCGVRRLDDPPVETVCGESGTLPTSELEGATPEGLVGMGGNVWEWVADAYAPDAYAGGDATDPRGPAEGAARVQRGGGWASTDPLELRAAARGSLVPDGKLPDVGVRCARDEAP